MPGHYSTFDILQGVDGAFAMNSINVYAYSEEPVVCEIRNEVILNATLTSPSAFDADRQERVHDSCPNEAQAQPDPFDGLLSRHRFTRE